MVSADVNRNPDDYRCIDDERVERLLFVGITRAMKWVYMSSTDPYSLAPLDTLGAAEDDGSLEIQTTGSRPPDDPVRAGGHLQPAHRPAADDEKDGDELIDLL